MASIKIKGMSCGHCVAAVTKALHGVEGIADVKVDLLKGEATYSETKPVDREAVKAAIRAIGFTVE